MRYSIIAAAAVTALTVVAPAVAAPAPSSLTLAYDFLDTMMDQHATGTALRLPQSFTGGTLQKDGYTDSVTYDDALVIDAFLVRGTADDIARAEVLGNSLLYVQAHDPEQDGRIRAAYAPTPLTSPGRSPRPTRPATSGTWRGSGRPWSSCTRGPG